MIFSVSVPGFGQVFAESTSRDAAIATVRQFLNRNQIVLPEGAEIDTAIPATAADVGNRLLIRGGDTQQDTPAEAVATGEASVPGGSQPATQPSVQSAQSIFVGKVIGANGVPSFFRVNAADTSTARSILESRFQSPAFVQIVSTPEFLFEADADFLEAVQDGQFSSVDAYVQSLSLVTAPDATDPNEDRTGDNLPVDIQDFPFASFQNAVAELGLDPEGTLGSTVSRQFENLAPVAQIGSLTGTIDPIGQAPGALEAFFRDEFGNREIAAQTFRDLLAGQTAGDLSADQLLAFSSLADPNIATGRGRGAAADVFRLARAAAENQFGSFVASRLLPSNQRLFRELERQFADGGQGAGFLEFARTQNLLPA